MRNALRETAAGAFAGTIYKRRSTRCLPLVMSAAGNICVLECVPVKEQKEDEEQEEQEECRRKRSNHRRDQHHRPREEEEEEVVGWVLLRLRLLRLLAVLELEDQN